MIKTILVCALAVANAYGQAAKNSTQAESKQAQGASSATSSQSTAGANRPTEATINEFLRKTFGYDENLKWKVTEIKPAADPALTEVSILMNTPQGQQGLKLFVTPDQKYAISGDFVPFGSDPYAPMRKLLEEKAKGPSRGAANAELTIVEFGDLQCPACKRAQPTIDKLMSETPNARLVFEQFPLTNLHKWAMTAARYATCVNKQNKDAFWKFISTVYDHQDEMQQMSVEDAEKRLQQYAGEVGVNAAEVQQCSTSPAAAMEVNSSEQLGKEVDVTGTPTLFMNGRKIGNVGGLPYETLKAIAEFQAKSK
jgi:protein-disulfide isomerase